MAPPVHKLEKDWLGPAVATALLPPLDISSRERQDLGRAFRVYMPAIRSQYSLNVAYQEWVRLTTLYTHQRTDGWNADHEEFCCRKGRKFLMFGANALL
ncbi:hypothetical protein SARC_06798 [Sphaeroforma arctica JP610]|uniref:Uncharacterized protein n=1 Tax=Sphaeroforma arctica JP610 TaxID=667725 RepID=A0A0L0FVI9_9EUKA|nr:hypothetical protein SARC_06798 [Sphaeroforma arctica JP610]KNC80857.1 hypothetical protein SARC_06798 [Sphaeroforma arctica JP610]|eukprot:XP_014154759.1 hypothetical protein SARC_06798 [Sphaeroforma arctica JP610]